MAQRADLEAKMIENPGDVDLRMVYADLLQSAGDPRGELIVLQHRGNQADVDAYLAKHEDALLGPLVRFKKRFDAAESDAFEWHLGFIRKATIGYESYTAGDLDEDADECTADRVVSALLQHPSALLLEELTVTLNMLEDGNYFDAVCKAIAELGAPALRSLRLGEYQQAGPGGVDTGYDYENSWSTLGDASGMWAKLPRLERLRLQMNLGGYHAPDKVGTFDLPHLREVEVVSGGLSAENARAFASGDLPALESMELWFGDDNYGGNATPKDLEPLFAATNVPKLRHLGIMNAGFTDEAVAVLAPSPLLRQLQELTLEHGTLTAEGAQTIVAHADAFRHLKLLDVNNNCFSGGVPDDLRSVCPVVSSEQRGEDDRYVPLSE